MENIKNRNLWIGLGVFVVVFLGIVFWSMKNSNSKPTPLPDTLATNGGPSTIGIGTTSKGAGVHTGTPTNTISYAEALVKYKDARLQLDTTCQALASPANLTFKNNTSIMIDNRAPVDRIVRVDPDIFTVKAFDFKIIKLSSTKLPATLGVDCAGSRNVATIKIQK